MSGDSSREKLTRSASGPEFFWNIENNGYICSVTDIQISQNFLEFIPTEVYYKNDVLDKLFVDQLLWSEGFRTELIESRWAMNIFMSEALRYLHAPCHAFYLWCNAVVAQFDPYLL